jgi:flagellin
LEKLFGKNCQKNLRIRRIKMAIGDISLTAGMRSNLISLQGTVDLLNRTQERLSSGKKVNSALDDATSYFTALAHMTDASDLSSLKNGMAEAVQTVKQADAGVSAITSLIASAKALAAQAKATSDAGSSAGKSETLEITSNLQAGDAITVGGSLYTAVAAITGDGSTQFLIGSTADITAQNLAAIVNTQTEATTGMNANYIGNATITLQRDDYTNLDATDVGVGGVSGGAVTETIATTSTGRLALAEQFNSIMEQIGNLALDSGYNGVNLLAGATETLSVDFGNSHTLNITGFDGTGNLAPITGGTSTPITATANWAALGNVDTDIALVNSASDTLQVGSQNLSNNLSMVTARQNWTTDAINVLIKGSDNLVLADMNEEGANMLMLQTRQALGTTALSLSSQASQSVLRLFA